MTDKINDGGPASPVHWPTATSKGMSLRDHFAAKVLPAVYAEVMQDAREGSGLFQDADWRLGIAIDAYAMADEMLKARGNTP